jgi:diacylglycerol kinase family enzyme
LSGVLGFWAFIVLLDRGSLFSLFRGGPVSVHQKFGSRSRNESEKIVCILNPKAQGGKAGAAEDRIRKAIAGAFLQWELVLTESPGHATQLAQAAIEGGADIVAAIGGDGTCHEVINGFFEEDKPRSRKTKFALIPWGTGSDLARTIRAPSRLEDALWVAATGMTLPTDVGFARFTDLAGAPESQVFINSAGFGCNGAVVAKANASSKKFGGKLTFLGATFSTLATYDSAVMNIEWQGPDGAGRWAGPLLSTFLMNGSFCGGGMKMGIKGTMHDGLLDLTILPPMGFVEAVAKSWRLFDGSADKVKGARVLQVESLKVEAEGADKVLIELDGEQPGVLPLEVRVLKGALQIRGGWLASPLLKSEHKKWRPSKSK